MLDQAIQHLLFLKGYRMHRLGLSRKLFGGFHFIYQEDGNADDADAADFDGFYTCFASIVINHSNYYYYCLRSKQNPCHPPHPRHPRSHPRGKSSG